MMTPDDGTTEGSSRPSLFPADPTVIDFCHGLRKQRTIDKIHSLPLKTGRSYSIGLHCDGDYFTKDNREAYFNGINKSDQLLFLDPDNGFEPKSRATEKHVLYSDVEKLLDQLSDNSVLSVFQHFRRKPFVDDYAGIQERLISGHSTAVYWHSLMFVQISKSDDVIRKVIDANNRYAMTHPVEVI
jgi:hypothetical protein